jgi:large subunit ribosomal protein L32
MSIRMRHTRGHTGNRRSHHALEAVQVVKDKETGNLRLPHRIDEVTGMYRGKQIAPAKVVRVAAPKVHAVAAEPTGEHVHDHAHEHANAEMKAVEATVAKVKRAPRASKKTGE